MATVLEGPINRARKKADLLAIANALGIDLGSKATVNGLVASISGHLRDHPELSTEPRFQRLYAYRSTALPSTASEGHAVAKGVGKTSADRAREDAMEDAKKVPAQATGAHKTLLNLKVTHDPPPSRRRLGTAPSTNVDADRGDHSVMAGMNTDDSSVHEKSSPELSTPPLTPSTEGHPEVPPAANSRILGGEPVRSLQPRTPMKEKSIVVAFQHQDDPKRPVDEVYLQESVQVPVVRGQPGDEDGCFVRLSQLLPVAIENASTPMKRQYFFISIGWDTNVIAIERGGRLYRPGFTAAGSRIAIGSMEAISQRARVLSLESSKVDTYRLERVEGDEDILMCRLFLQEGAPTPKSGATHSEPLHIHLSPSPTPAPQAKLVQATERVRATMGFSKATMSEATGAADGEAFIEYLRDLLEGPKNQWRKAKTVGHILQRRKAVERAMQVVEELGWEKSKGGYQIPEADYDDAGVFAGRHFVKEDILRALRLGHSQANSDASLFRRQDLDRLPELDEWYKDPEGPHAKRFAHMTIKEFEAYKAHGLEKKEKARKYEQASDGEAARPVKKMKKAKKVYDYDSDDLDS
ncbi:hypothetical protein ACG7TL_007938 [Trametes sanguinea]